MDIIIETAHVVPVDLYTTIALFGAACAAYGLMFIDRDNYSDVVFCFVAGACFLMNMAWSFWGVLINMNIYKSEWIGTFWLICMGYMLLIGVVKIMDIARREGDLVSV
jgi:hypothetical protein